MTWGFRFQTAKVQCQQGPTFWVRLNDLVYDLPTPRLLPRALPATATWPFSARFRKHVRLISMSLTYHWAWAVWMRPGWGNIYEVLNIAIGNECDLLTPLTLPPRDLLSISPLSFSAPYPYSTQLFARTHEGLPSSCSNYLHRKTN